MYVKGKTGDPSLESRKHNERWSYLQGHSFIPLAYRLIGSQVTKLQTEAAAADVCHAHRDYFTANKSPPPISTRRSHMHTCRDLLRRCRGAHSCLSEDGRRRHRCH